MGKRFLLIGHSVLDTIISGSEKTVRPGGIFYSAMGLMNLIEEEDSVTLITNYDETSYPHFSEIYSKTEFKYSSKVEKILHVELTIYKYKERSEKFSHLNQKIVLPQNIRYNDFDFILINMITGYELSPIDLQEIKSQTNAKIYFDVHSLSRGMDENNIRYHRKISDRKDWMKSIDILQANEFELLTLSDFTKESEIAEEILSTNVEILLITKGSRGSEAFFIEENNIKNYSLPAIKINAVNSVGCGDIFGASFVYYFSKTNDIYGSLKFANKAAGIITSYSGISDYRNMKKDLENNYV